MCQVQVPANVRAGTLSLLTGALEIKPLMLQVTPVYSAEMSQKYQLRSGGRLEDFLHTDEEQLDFLKEGFLFPLPAKMFFFPSSHYCGGMLLH